MGHTIIKGGWRRVHTIFRAATEREIRFKYWTIVFILAALLAACLSISLPDIAAAQASHEVNYPDPFEPGDNAQEVPVKLVRFQWKPFYVNTEEYKFQLSKNADMSKPLVDTTVRNWLTLYEYRGNLEYNTTYWWRVMAEKPPGGTWSPQFRFTTEAKPPAKADESEESSSFLDSFVDFLKDKWLLVILVAAAIIAVVVAGIIVMKPASQPPGRAQWQGFPQQTPGSQRTIPCPACGTQNSMDRKFCSNCGTSLTSRGQQQAWATQQTPTCPSCGSPNAPGRKFCGSCGASLTGSGQQQAWAAQQTPTCPSCGSSNPQGRKFCGNCGASLTSEAPQQIIDTQVTNVCPACGSPNSAERKFCGNCGGSLASTSQEQSYEIHQAFTCPICGAALNPGSNPCSNCGTWLDWGS